MTKNKKIIIFVLLLMGAVTSYWWIDTHNKTSEVVEASGTIEATNISIKPSTSGYINSLFIKEGNQISKGQTLATIARPDLWAQKERDAAAVQAAQNQLALLESGAREQEISAAQAALEIARVNLEQSNIDLERMQELRAAEAISEQEFEKIQTQYKINQENFNAAQAKLDLINAGNRNESIEAARADLTKAQAVLKATEANLNDLTLLSPADGRIINVNFESGEYVQLGNSIATLADLNDLWVKVFIPTDELPLIKLGQKVHCTVSGVDTIFTGMIDRIADQGEYTPRTVQTKKERANVVFAVTIKLDPADGVLKPGMPADVVFIKE